jgi:hypothetical protein
MRKFVLIAAALVLASASAQAGGSRSLTLASNDDPLATTQAAPATEVAPAAAPADAPKYVERPSAVDTKATPDQPKVDGKTGSKPIVKADRKKHRESTEARVIYELHRHGIYW